MNVVWLDEPPYVMRNTCDCYPDCRECTRCECCCACGDCYEERQRQEWEDA